MIGDRVYRAYKPHYHWSPPDKVTRDGVTLHATLCVACCDESLSVDWKEFAEQQKKTPEEYKVASSLNAPLPDRFLSVASKLYSTQATNWST
jgi:hypothetical protein